MPMTPTGGEGDGCWDGRGGKLKTDKDDG